MRERVVAYVVRGDEVLVFDHADDPGAGTQVPAGGVAVGESLEDAVRREVLEEMGLRLTTPIRFLGSRRHLDGLGRRARSSFFEIEAPSDTARAWIHTVGDDGDDRGLRFECRFEHAPSLVPDQSRAQPLDRGS